MAPESLICIRDADHGSHPEALPLNPSFRPGVPILKLAVEIVWTPPRPAAALADLEARLVKLCPSLQEHQCRGQTEYHILRSIDSEERQLDEGETIVEPALALAHLFEHVMIDAIAFITDTPVVSGATAALRGTFNRFDIFVESPEEVASGLTVELARSWMSAMVAGESPDSMGRLTLELARYLYCTQEAVEVGEVARHLGLKRRAVREGLEWLERIGLTRQVRYALNLSGLSYYSLHRTANLLQRNQ